jgi:hypothetical protein
MRPTGWGHRIRGAFEGRLWQSLAMVFCVLFGIAMIVNNQLQGEAWWFWYATLFHSGVKLYADLHLALQPLVVLQTDAWMQLFGIKCLVTEIPSVICVFVLCRGIFLILRESDWPHWQKAIVLAGAFLISVECSAYRFDDYHMVEDMSFTIYSLVALLKLAKADAAGRQLGLAAGLGILSGLTITTRLNDGLALLVAAGVCLLFLVRKRKLAVAGLFVLAAAVTVVLVVRLTGDSFSDYLSNSIIRAVGARGGAGSISTAPFRMFHSAFQALRGRRWLFLWTAGIVAVSAVVQHYWKDRFRYLVALQLGMAGLVYVFSSRTHRAGLREGMFFSFMVLSLCLLSYLLVPVVAARYVMSKTGHGKREWDAREILILFPFAELASTSASSGGTVLLIFWSPIALLLLLVPVIQPLRRQASWLNATLVTVMALMGLCAVKEKVQNPYAWLHFQSSPMFENRQWYRHPVYGPMYMDKDQLNFILPICEEIKAGNPNPELLSMPWAYPNYFCDTPPWRGYVQTYYDTTTRAVIEQLMRELDTAPPQWIVYMREDDNLTTIEQVMNGGRPLPHRYLDQLILQKIATGQWQVVQRSDYLFRWKKDKQDGWYLIRTRP